MAIESQPLPFRLDGEELFQRRCSGWSCSARESSPVSLVTGCSCSEWKEHSNKRTSSKSYFPGREDILCNVSLPFVLQLAESGRRVIAQCAPHQTQTLSVLFQGLPYAERIRLLPVNLDDTEFSHQLDALLADWSRYEPISRVDFLLYESYTADVSRPFLPTWEENMLGLKDAIYQRLRFFQLVSNYTYFLLSQCQQQELRVVALTALASYRAVAYLFADAAHKAISSKFLQTWALEASAHVRKPIAIIELCPGIVDTGLYDPVEVRRVSRAKAEINGRPFSEQVKFEDINTWPMLAPNAIAEIGSAYLTSRWEDKEVFQSLAEKHRKTLSAGYETSEMLSQARQTPEGETLPLYSFYPGYPWGELPGLTKGYQPVFLTPVGHRA